MQHNWFLRFYFGSRFVQTSLVILNALEVVLLIVLTYADPPGAAKANFPLRINDVDNMPFPEEIVITISSLFIIDLILSLILHEFALTYFTSLSFIISMTSCIPWITIFLPKSAFHWIFIFSFARLLKIPEIFRMSEYLRISHIHPSQLKSFLFSTTDFLNLDEIKHSLVTLVVQILTFFLFASGAVYIMDYYYPGSFIHDTTNVLQHGRLDEPKLQFLSCVYFIIITIATVGYVHKTRFNDDDVFIEFL